MMFCKNVVLHGHFVICICPRLVRIYVASIKHYLNTIKAKQSALNARKPLVGGREPHLCSRLFGFELWPFNLAPVGIHHLVLSNLTAVHRITVAAAVLLPLANNVGYAQVTPNPSVPSHWENWTFV